MRLHRIKLVNFRQHARTEIHLKDGITGIIGPNGSGKTTILEAIAWALYGNPAIRGTRDSIRFTGAGPRAQVEVELDFDLAGHRYRVTRGLTTAALYLDGSDQAIANSITGVTELLQHRLGMTRSEFFSTYFTGQKELSVMASMGPTERAQFLSRVLGYERLRMAQDLIRERRRMIGAEIAGLRSGMPDVEAVNKAVLDADSRLAECIAASNEAGTKHAQALSELGKVTPVWESIQRLREEWQRLMADVTIAEREVESLGTQIARLTKEIESIGPTGEELESLRAQVAPLPGLLEEIKLLDDLFRQEGRRQALVDNERVLREEIALLADRYARLEMAPVLEEEVTVLLETKRSELEVVSQTLDAQRTEWVRDRQEAETKLNELRRQYTDVKHQREQIISLGPDGVCPTCNRKLGDTYTDVVDQLGEQLATLHVDGQYYRDRGEQLEKLPASITSLEEQRKQLTSEVGQLEKKLTKIQLAVQELPQVLKEMQAKENRLNDIIKELAALSDKYDGKRHHEVRSEIERLTVLNNRVVHLNASMERIPALIQERETVAEAREKAMEKLKGLQNQHATRAFSERDYTDIRDAFEHATAASRTTELAVVAAQGDVRNAQRALDDAHAAKAEYARIAESLNKLQSERKVHDELDRTYADLRTDLNLQLRPELSDLASSFLGELTDDRYSQLELDDQYNILILEDGRSKPVISGGEEDLANLVLRLAISQMIAERAGQAFSLLILDEVFGSLDIARRENVVELLRRVQDRFEQVILITHIESIRDGVDQVISVRHDEESGSSVVETFYDSEDESDPLVLNVNGVS